MHSNAVATVVRHKKLHVDLASGYWVWPYGVMPVNFPVVAILTYFSCTEIFQPFPVEVELHKCVHAVVRVVPKACPLMYRAFSPKAESLGKCHFKVCGVCQHRGTSNQIAELVILHFKVTCV